MGDGASPDESDHPAEAQAETPKGSGCLALANVSPASALSTAIVPVPFVAAGGRVKQTRTARAMVFPRRYASGPRPSRAAGAAAVCPLDDPTDGSSRVPEAAGTARCTERRRHPSAVGPDRRPPRVLPTASVALRARTRLHHGDPGVRTRRRRSRFPARRRARHRSHALWHLTGPRRARPARTRRRTGLCDDRIRHSHRAAGFPARRFGAAPAELCQGRRCVGCMTTRRAAAPVT